MYCTNCGIGADEKATACTKCGMAPRMHKKFCHKCGVEINSQQVLCLKCGASLEVEVGPSSGTGKNKIASAAMALLIGNLGIHKFYHGSWGWGIVYLLLSWTFLPMIAGIIEGIMYIKMDVPTYDAKYNKTAQAPFKW